MASMAGRSSRTADKAGEPSRRRLASNFVPEVVDERPISTKLNTNSLASSTSRTHNQHSHHTQVPPPNETATCAIFNRKDFDKTTAAAAGAMASPETLKKQELCSYLKLVKASQGAASGSGGGDDSLYQMHRRSHRIRNNLLLKEKKDLERKLQESDNKSSRKTPRTLSRSQSVDTRQKQRGKNAAAGDSKMKRSNSLERANFFNTFEQHPEKVRKTMFMSLINGRLTPTKCITSTANRFISTDLQPPAETTFKTLEVHAKGDDEERIATQQKAAAEVAKLKQEVTQSKAIKSIMKKVTVDHKCRNDLPQKLNVDLPSTSKAGLEHFASDAQTVTNTSFDPNKIFKVTKSKDGITGLTPLMPIPLSKPGTITLPLNGSNPLNKHSVITLKRIDTKRRTPNPNDVQSKPETIAKNNEATAGLALSLHDKRTGELNKNLIFQIIGVTHYMKENDGQLANASNAQTALQPVQSDGGGNKRMINNCQFVDLTQCLAFPSTSRDHSGNQNPIRKCVEKIKDEPLLEPAANDEDKLLDETCSESLSLNLSPVSIDSVITVSSRNASATSLSPMRKKRKTGGILKPKLSPPKVPWVSPRKRAKQLAMQDGARPLPYFEHNYSKCVDVNDNDSSANGEKPPPLPLPPQPETQTQVDNNGSKFNGMAVAVQIKQEPTPFSPPLNVSPPVAVAAPIVALRAQDDHASSSLSMLNEMPEVIPFRDDVHIERKSLQRTLVKRVKKKSLDEPDPNCMPRDYTIALDVANGPVIRCFYFEYNLVITQPLCVSFWKQSGLGCFLESQRMWIPRGSIQRPDLDSQCVRKECDECVVCMPENGIVYVELWTKEHRSDFRETPVCDVFVVLYFRRNGARAPEKKLLQLENITGCADDVTHVVLKYANCVILSWKSFNGTSSSSQTKWTLRCYYFSTDYQKIIVVREFESTKHSIQSLHNIEDCDRLVLAFGDGVMSIWNLQYLFKSTTLDISHDMPPNVKNVSFKCDRGVLFVLQQLEHDNVLRLMAINAVTLSWKVLQYYKPPDVFIGFRGACIENGLLICFYGNGMIGWSMESGAQIAAEYNSDCRYWPSGSSIISIQAGQLMVRNVLSYIITNNAE